MMADNKKEEKNSQSTEQSEVSTKTAEVKKAEQSEVSAKDTAVKKAEQSEVSVKPATVKKAEQSEVSVKDTAVKKAEQSEVSTKDVTAKKAEQSEVSTKGVTAKKAEQSEVSTKGVTAKKAEQSEVSVKPADLKKSEHKKPIENPIQEKSSSSVASLKSAEKANLDEQTEKTQIKEDSVKLNEKAEVKKTNKETVKLNGLFAFKISMSSFYNEKGKSIPVTALKYEPCFVSQIKTQEKESYSAVQLAFKAQKNKRCSKALIQHLAPAGFKEGARFVKEIRQSAPKGIKLGQELSIESLKKGDLVKISARSKGRGFTGVMKRWNFAGGKASHGSKSHRGTGSIGQHTEPSRVFAGRKMPGRYGYQKVSRSKALVVDVLTEEGIIFVKGPVPGARNTLISIQKMQGLEK